MIGALPLVAAGSAAAVGIAVPWVQLLAEIVLLPKLGLTSAATVMLTLIRAVSPSRSVAV